LLVCIRIVFFSFRFRCHIWMMYYEIWISLITLENFLVLWVISMLGNINIYGWFKIVSWVKFSNIKFLICIESYYSNFPGLWCGESFMRYRWFISCGPIQCRYCWKNRMHSHPRIIVFIYVSNRSVNWLPHWVIPSDNTHFIEMEKCR